MVGVVQLVEHQIVVLGVVGSSPITHPIMQKRIQTTVEFAFFIGLSPSGKAKDFDSFIRWFESSQPNQLYRRELIQ